MCVCVCVCVCVGVCVCVLVSSGTVSTICHCLMQMLADSLLACHSASVTASRPLSLKVFVSGRGRLEDEGAIALADAFKVRLGFAFTK